MILWTHTQREILLFTFPVTFHLPFVSGCVCVCRMTTNLINKKKYNQKNQKKIYLWIPIIITTKKRQTKPKKMIRLYPEKTILSFFSSITRHKKSFFICQHCYSFDQGEKTREIWQKFSEKFSLLSSNSQGNFSTQKNLTISLYHHHHRQHNESMIEYHYHTLSHHTQTLVIKLKDHHHRDDQWRSLLLFGLIDHK